MAGSIRRRTLKVAHDVVEQLRHHSSSHPFYLSKMYLPSITVSKKNQQSHLTCKSQKLMIETGLIRQAGSEGYHLLPFALRAVEKLIRLIDEEMLNIGAQKMSMPTFGSAMSWKKSGRWDAMNAELFQFEDRHHVQYCLSPTHEESITNLVAADINLSHRNLPLRLYQITPKFRDEMRPRYGLLRAREFLMKDLYTFDTCIENARETYDAVCEVYGRLFERLKLQYIKVDGDTGEIGGSLSHEFHLPSSIGEDEIYTCNVCGVAANIETQVDGQSLCVKGKSGKDCFLKNANGIEVGHAFYLGTKYSKVFKSQFQNTQQKTELTEMGCFGLGVTRIVAAAVEVLSSEKELRWPSIIAPYQICIIPPKKGSREDGAISTLELHDRLITNANHLKGEIVLDDRTHMTIGRRLNDASRLGYPVIVVCGKALLQDKQEVEVYMKGTEEMKLMAVDDVIHQASLLKTIS